MSGLAFDTPSFSRRPQKGGFTQGQAETLASEQGRLIDDQLASKSDIARLELKIATVRADLVREIEASRSDARLGLEHFRILQGKDLEILKRDLTMRLSTIIGGMLVTVATVLGILSRFPILH